MEAHLEVFRGGKINPFNTLCSFFYRSTQSISTGDQRWRASNRVAACLSCVTRPDACPGSPAAGALRGQPALSPAEAITSYGGSTSAGSLPSPAGSWISCSATVHVLEGLWITPRRLFHLSTVNKLTQTAAGLWSISSHLLSGFIMVGLCPGEAERLVSLGQAVLVQVVAQGLKQLLKPWALAPSPLQRRRGAGSAKCPRGTLRAGAALSYERSLCWAPRGQLCCPLFKRASKNGHQQLPYSLTQSYHHHWLNSCWVIAGGLGWKHFPTPAEYQVVLPGGVLGRASRARGCWMSWAAEEGCPGLPSLHGLCVKLI